MNTLVKWAGHIALCLGAIAVTGDPWAPISIIGGILLSAILMMAFAVGHVGIVGAAHWWDGQLKERRTWRVALLLLLIASTGLVAPTGQTGLMMAYIAIASPLATTLSKLLKKGQS